MSHDIRYCDECSSAYCMNCSDAGDTGSFCSSECEDKYNEKFEVEEEESGREI